MNKLKFISSHFATILWNVLFGYGVLSIVYGYYTIYSKSAWLDLDQLIKFLGFLLTLTSVIITCLSIYFNSNNEPSLLSKFFSAPAVIIIMLLVAAESVLNNHYPPEAVSTGISLIGLSGALHQIIPRLHEKKYTESQG